MIIQEKRQIMVSCAFIVMIGGFVMLRYLPLRERIKIVKQTKAAERSDVNTRQFQSRQVPVLEEQAEKLGESVGDYEARIPQGRELGVFLGRITGLMSEHNLAEQVVTPGGQINSKELNCIPVDIQCKGNLSEIFQFFKGLQSLERLVRIEEVKLINDVNFSGEVTLNTRAVIYFRGSVGEG